MDAAGRYLPLSLGRRLMVDLLHACRDVPFIPIERTMALGPLARARGLHPLRPSWVALFVKAFSVVSPPRPVLRRVYLSFPWPRMFESGDPVATVAVERVLGDEPVVLPAMLRGPESRSVAELDEWVKYSKTESVERIGSYRRVFRLSALPLPVRRAAWWLATECWGKKKARLVGTFVVSVTSGLGAETLLVRAPTTSTLHYGVLGDDGRMPVRLTFDHRVYDGATAPRVLAELEDVLLGEVLAELTAFAESSLEQTPDGYVAQWRVGESERSPRSRSRPAPR